MNNITHEQVIAYFSALPSKKTREYEKSISKLASSVSTAEEIKVLRSICASDSKYAYEAFFSYSHLDTDTV